MRRLPMFLAALCCAAHAFAQSAGPLVAVGGGTTEAIVRRTLDLAGGRDAVVVVLPQDERAA